MKIPSLHPFSGASLVLGSALLWFLAGCGGEDRASPERTPLVMQTDWYAQPEHGGFYQAIAAGHYAAAGLEVTIKQGGPNALVAQKVARGTADFGMGRMDDVMVLVDKGLPLVIVSALMQHDPQGLMLHASNPISSIAEMDGQRIMIGAGSVMVQIMEKHYGLDLQVLPLDFGIGRFMADPGFIQQCFVTNEPYFVRKNGGDPKVILISEMGFDPYRVIFTRRELVEEQPEAVAAFVEATIRGWAEYIDPAVDRTAANALIVADNKLVDDPEFLEYAIGAMNAHALVAGHAEDGEAIGLLREERLQEGIDLLREFGLIENLRSASEVYTTAFLPAELQAMLAE